MWPIGLAVDLGTPLTALNLQVHTALSASHLPERFGLVTILLLGEAVLVAVQGIAEQEWRRASAATAGLGFAVTFCLWRISFDNVDESAVRRLRLAGQVWL